MTWFRPNQKSPTEPANRLNLKHSKKTQLKACLYTCLFKFLTHAFSFSNKKIPNENLRHCCAFLPWLLKNNLGLAQLALKTHAFSACINGVLQLGFYRWNWILLSFVEKEIYISWNVRHYERKFFLNKKI